jgi:hypothetical protein
MQRHREQIILQRPAFVDPIRYDRSTCSMKADGGQPKQKWNASMNIYKELRNSESYAGEETVAHKYFPRTLVTIKQGASLAKFLYQRSDKSGNSKNREPEMRNRLKEDCGWNTNNYPRSKEKQFLTKIIVDKH